MAKKITIVGAGLVGSLWAYLLKQKGYEVEVFEKRSDPTLENAESGRSINLVITSRGLYGLEKAGLKEKILPITVPVYGRQVYPLDAAPYYQPYGRDNSECNYSVSRLELNKSLIREAKLAGVKIHFDHGLDKVDLKTKKLFFENSHSAEYDLLFATDGAGSAVRRSLLEADPDIFQESIEWLDVDYKEMQMPAKDGQPAIEKNALHIWPRGRHMLMALANGDGSFTMTVYIPKEGKEISFTQLDTPEEVKKYFSTYFSSAIEHMPYYVEEFLENPQGSLGTVRMSQWVYQDSVALMGDAAHAVVPFFGQGMNCGFEDCTSLLGFVEESRGDWAQALELYDQKQRPNGNAIADMAIENFTEMAEKVGDEQFKLRKKIEARIEQAFPELYRSRYAMVTYTLIPYAIAQRAGRIQADILAKLSEGITTVEELDIAKAKALIESEYTPWLKQNLS